MKKSNRWFWVKLFGPGLLALPFILSILSNIFGDQSFIGFAKGFAPIPLYGSTTVAFIWAMFFPKKHSSRLVIWMIVIGLALFFFITIVSIESENLFEFPVYVLDILALVSLGLIFVGLGLNIIFAFNIKPKRKSFLEVVRHSASALWALTFILIYGYRTYSHLSPNPKIPHILYKYSSELGIVFILLAGIGYYISSIWDHENLGSENHDGLIEEIGA